MRLAMIGLGRMGLNMVHRLKEGGHDLVVYDLSAESIKKAEAYGAKAVKDLAELKTELKGPRVVWVMLPAGDVTDSTIQKLGTILERNDIIIDGGNTYFKDDVRRAQVLAAPGIKYMDVGTSGGIWGFENGYSLMIGGEKNSYELLEPIFKTLAPGSKTGNPPVVPTPKRPSGRSADQGYIHCGPVGSGHFRCWDITWLLRRIWL